jgi:hypothetical protein
MIDITKLAESGKCLIHVYDVVGMSIRVYKSRLLRRRIKKHIFSVRISPAVHIKCVSKYLYSLPLS